MNIECRSEAPRCKQRVIFTSGKYKVFSGKSPEATGSEIGIANFAIQKPQRVSPCNLHKNFAPFIPAPRGRAFATLRSSPLRSTSWRGFCKYGRPGGTRTLNTRFWRPVLCQIELLAFQESTLANLTMKGMLTVKPTILLQLQSVGCAFFVLSCCIIPALTFSTSQGYNFSNHTFPLFLHCRF